MSMTRILAMPALIAIVGGGYFLFSGETAGAVLLVIFAAAMAVFLWSLVPTLDNAGPTAPVDPDFEL